LKDVEARSRRTESEIWAFREANRIVAPGAESSVLMSLFTQVRGDIEKARHQRTELESIQQRLAGLDAAAPTDRVFVETSNPAMQKLQGTLSELQLERKELSLEVADRHPRLQAIDDRIREVRSEMRREVGAQIAMLRNREEFLNRQIGELQQKNRELPTLELSLQRLQREAKTNDDLLALLKTKHQEALIKEAEQIEEVSIVRPAIEPDSPTGGGAGKPTQGGRRRWGVRRRTRCWSARCWGWRSASCSRSCARRSTPRSGPSRTSRPTWACRCSAWCRTSIRARPCSGSSTAGRRWRRSIPRRC